MKTHSLLLVALAIGLGGAFIGCGGDSNSPSSGGSGGSSSSSAAGGTGGTGAAGSSSSASSGGPSSSSSSSSGAPSTYDCTAASGAPGALKLTQIAGSLGAPVLVKAAPDDPDRLYIVEQGGMIKIWESGAVLPTPFLDAGPLLNPGGEEGLLGLAFHPDYKQNGRFFIHYSDKVTHDSTIQEFKRSAGDLHVADPAAVQLVLKHPTAQPNHNGGSIEFGQDGYLYIALGDGGNQNDPECDAQNPQNLFGKLSRLDVDQAASPTGYPAAAGNPGGNKQFHIGFRNPWRISLDVCTGDFYIGDVGQNNYEEIDVVSTNPPVAKNMGWPFREAAHDHANTCPADPGPWTEPIAEYDHGQGCSVTGGYVYRGSKIPWLRGTYFYGDYCTSLVWMIHYASGAVDTPVLVTGVSQQIGNISSFGQDGRGEVYVVEHGGKVFRIDPG